MQKTNNFSVVVIRVPRLRRMNMRVNLGNEVVIRAPKRTTDSAVQKFITEKNNWIQKQISTMNSLVPLSRERLLELKKLAHIFLPDRVHMLAKKHNFAYASVTCRHQLTRWGSCSHKNRINLNVELMRLPEKLRDYIIIHELTHTIHKHHQKAFWNALERTLPGAKKLDKEMKGWKIGYESQGG
ncbi:MAG: YgjP-like metallopeptidase domain-containing protein [Candidatus Gracilibacteria bacterium]